MKNIKDYDVKDKRVLVRCDFDVPMDSNGNILDDFRIKQDLPTIKYLMEAKAKVILIGHAGRPNGKVVESLRLIPIQKKLTEYLGIEVNKPLDCIGRDIEKLVEKMKSGEVLLLENVRFHKGETENNEEFAKKLAKLGDIYVNNAFANSHRAHASMTKICKYLPSVAGFTLKKEIEVLNNLIKNPEKPLVVIIGGAKVEETKLKLINRFSEIAAEIIIGGLVKKEVIEKKIKLKNPKKILGPIGNLSALDINNESINLFREKILVAKTILWNGPFGKFEDDNYKRGTLEIANAIIESGAFSVVGGGQTIEFLDKENIISKFSYVSTGGGAMLSYLAGDILPGLKALE